MSMRIAMHTIYYIFIDSSISDQQSELFNDNSEANKKKIVSLFATFLNVANINNKWAQKPKFNTFILKKFSIKFKKINNFRHFFVCMKKGNVR